LDKLKTDPNAEYPGVDEVKAFRAKGESIWEGHAYYRKKYVSEDDEDDDDDNDNDEEDDEEEED
jgi:hypothetical protein